MKHLIILFLTFLTYNSQAQQGEWLWVKDYMGSRTQITSAAEDSFFLSGPYAQVYQWTNPPFPNYAQDYSAYMTKYDGQGNWAWVKCYGYNELWGAGETTQTFVSSSGDIYALFNFWRPYAFEGDTVIDPNDSANPEVILAKYNSSGNLLWRERFRNGDSQVFGNEVSAPYMCFDDDENIYISGSFLGNIIIGDTLVNSPDTNTVYCNYLCKFDTNGNYIWLVKNKSYSFGEYIKYNPKSNQIVMPGYITESQMFDGYYFDSSEVYDTYLAFFDSNNGALDTLLVFPGGSSNMNELRSFDIADNGDMLLATNIYNESVVINGDSLVADHSDFILWKLDEYGSVDWFKHFKGDNMQKAKSIKIHSSGDIFINAECSSMLLLEDDTLWSSTWSHDLILQLASNGNLKNIIGANESRFTVNNFNLHNNDIIMHGWAVDETIGSWPVETYFIGRYHLGNIGIEEVNTIIDNQVLVYPNPASSQLKIESSFTISQISVYSIIGQFVKEQAANGKMVSLNVSDLLPGNYIIRCVGDQQDFARKIVVLR